MTEFLRLDGLFMVLAAPFVGSFLGLVAARLPVGRPVLLGRSMCDACGHVLGVWDLLPVLSWLASRGRCRHCDAPVSSAYPLIEATALAAALWSLAVLPGWLAWAGAGLGWALIALAAADARHGILPDEITLPRIVAGLAVAWGIDPMLTAHNAIGAAAGFAFVVAVREVYRRLRGREGMGLGDAKLLAAAGAWVGWQGLAGVLLIAAATGLAVAVVLRRTSPGDALPFGPFLALGIWLTWLYGPLMLG